MTPRLKRALHRLDMAVTRFFVLSSYPYVGTSRSPR